MGWGSEEGNSAWKWTRRLSCTTCGSDPETCTHVCIINDGHHQKGFRKKSINWSNNF